MSHCILLDAGVDMHELSSPPALATSCLSAMEVFPQTPRTEIRALGGTQELRAVDSSQAGGSHTLLSKTIELL